MEDNYITMHEDLMKKDRVAYGPYLELTILSFITTPKEWITETINGKHIKKEISVNEVIENKINFLMEKVEKIINMDEYFETTNEMGRIGKEIKYLCKKEIDYLDMELFINIGHKRNGRLMIELINDSIVSFNFMFIDEEDFKCRNDEEVLLNKLIESINGFCGTIGLESNALDIFKIDDLIINIGDGEHYGIENIKWNTKIKYEK
jgi:hypothetical protein